MCVTRINRQASLYQGNNKHTSLPHFWVETQKHVVEYPEKDQRRAF